MGRLKPRPTFSPHSSRYWTSSRRASVARAHVVVNGPSPPILLTEKGFLRHVGKPFLFLGQIWDRNQFFSAISGGAKVETH